MDLAVLAGWAVAVLLIAVRFSVAVGMSPVFTAYGIPGTARLALMVLLAALVQQASGVTLAQPDVLGIASAAAAEVINGVLLGLSVHVALAAFSIAGRMLDIQIGFGIGSVFDPVTRASSNVLSSLMGLLGVTLFIAVDAHVALASMLAASFEVLPLGALPAIDDPLQVAAAAGAMFSFGLALAAPVVLALFLTDIVVGVISRNSPQLNVLVLSIPLKILVGLFVLSLSLLTWQPLIDRVFRLGTDVLGGTR